MASFEAKVAGAIGFNLTFGMLALPSVKIFMHNFIPQINKIVLFSCFS